ncbi:MAG: DUF4357 domain-containing protein, partial [Lachnospiraceae bacterium]|nr:DUF4357 domain-containing protein [Lachnospiraceae bacterium]
QGIVSRYHYKGGKYDAVVRVELNNGNEIYIVEASSQVAPSWTDWVGVKKREEIVTGQYVASNNVVIKEVAFDSVSTAAKFITGTSTNGGGMLAPKNLISE